jgi:hypothetical protein
MKTRGVKTTSLFVVVLAAGCVYDGPRLLANGRPACGNVVAKGDPKPKPQPQPQPNPQPTPPPQPPSPSDAG